LPWQPFFGFLYMGAHWRHLANTTEPSVCGSDASLCQITLSTCYLFVCLECFDGVGWASFAIHASGF